MSSKSPSHPPPKPPKHLPMLQPERDFGFRQNEQRRVAQSLVHETMPNSLKQSIEHQAHESLNDHKVSIHDRRSQSETREDPQESNYASTISKYNRLHQSSKQLPQDQSQSHPIRVHQRFDSSAAYQSREVNDYSTSFVHQDTQNRSNNNSKATSGHEHRTGE